MNTTGISADLAHAFPKRVLVVEDDEAFLQSMTEWLTRAGHQVVFFNQFKAAKTYLATDAPNVLITGVRLGAFNGLQLVIVAKLEHPEMTAIVLTGTDDPVLRKETSNAGADY